MSNVKENFADSKIYLILLTDKLFFIKDDLYFKTMKHGSLFSGIGGFDLAAEWTGWENIFHCEINKFCQKVLKYHFPNSVLYEDITKTDFSEWRGKIDIITGGFPCQPYSVAGKRKGKADDRHLWPEMLRAIREIQPRWVVGENVPGLLNWKRGMVLAEIKTDLEAAGFEVFPPVILPACGKNAPHRRDRLWIVANNKSNRNIGRLSGLVRTDEKQQTQKKQWENAATIGSTSEVENATNCQHIGRERGIGKTIQWEPGISRQFEGSNQEWRNGWPISSPLVCGVDDGLPDRIHRTQALGNAIVPQIAYELFKAIEQFESANEAHTGDKVNN